MSFALNLAYLHDYCQKCAGLLGKPENITRNVLQIKNKTKSSIMCFIGNHLPIDFIFNVFLSFFRAIIYL